jgi:type I restriction enzyme S subunit
MNGQFLFDLPLPVGWRLLSVDDIKAPEKHSCVAGPFGSSISSRFFVEEGVPVIRGGNLRDDLTPFVAEGFAFVSPEQAQRYKGQHVRAGDLVFTCWGTLGQVGLIPKGGPFPEYIISNKQLKLRPNCEIADSKFLFYYFASPQMVRHIRSIAIGAAVPGINLGLLKALKVALPPLDVQKEIVRFLSVYDDLIENNTRRIKILEEMAQMLYREWFVNFRFPGHEKGRIVESELGPIPEGWKVQPLGDLTAVVTKGTTPTTLGRQFQDTGVNFVKVESITESGAIITNKLAKIDTETHELLKRSQLRHNDILFSIAGAIGRVALVPVRVLPANTNQALATLRCADSTFITYLLSTVRSAHFQNFSLGRVVQTAQANVSLSILKSAPILIPPPTLLKNFREAVEPILALVDVLSSHIENLRTTRDYLLPKLISGEIPVEAATELIEETV